MAYHIPRGGEEVALPYLPIQGKLKDGTELQLRRYEQSKDELQVFEILQHIVEVEGNSYPQNSMKNLEEFRAYYTTHDTFVLCGVGSGNVIGAFYVKPNFPGRCAHTCNAGFIVHQDQRGRGAANVMVRHFLPIARDLGYKQVFFNLVFVANEGSVYLWRKFGFTEIGRIPNAGDLKGRGMTDAIQFYYDLSTLPKTGIQKE